MTTVIIATIIFSVIAMNVIRLFGVPKWAASVGLLLVGVGFHVLSLYLHEHFIRRDAPQLFDEDRGLTHTSGTKFVPRWVSHITSLSIAAVFAAVLPWIVLLFRSLFG